MKPGCGCYLSWQSGWTHGRDDPWMPVRRMDYSTSIRGFRIGFLMRYVPFLILFYIWLIAGRADPGDVLQSVPIVRWMTYPLISLLLLAGILYIAVRGKYKKTVIDGPIILLIFLLALSTYLNGSPWIDLLYGIGVYLRYPLLFILFCNFPHATSKGQQFMHILTIIVVSLVLEAVFNFILFGKQGDTTFFTLGVSWGHRNAGIFFAAVLSLIAAHILLKGGRYYHGLLLSFVILAAWIASIRSTLVFSGLILLVVFAVHRRWLTTRGLTCMVIVITSMIFIATLVDWHLLLSASPVLSKFDPGYRLTFIREVLIHVPDSGNLFLGAGPRSMNPGVAGSAGVLYQSFLENAPWVVNFGSNQYVKGLAELGIAGMLVYWFMLYKVLKVAWRNWLAIRRSHSAPPWLKVVTLNFFGIWSFYACFGLMFNDLWRMDTSSLIFWFFAATIAVDYRNRRTVSVRFLAKD